MLTIKNAIPKPKKEPGIPFWVALAPMLPDALKLKGPVAAAGEIAASAKPTMGNNIRSGLASARNRHPGAKKAVWRFAVLTF